MKFLLFLLVFISIKSNASDFQAETKDTIAIDSFQTSRIKLTFKSQILPISLITTGSLLNIGEIKTNIQNKIPNTNNSLDDYLQYVPMAQMYLFDAVGFKHKNSVIDQTKYLAISQLSSSLIVHFLKNVTNVERPTGADYSFPSGHTAAAFVGATVLFQEFKNTEPLIAYSGYLFATTTGVLRMTNNAHWLPDILVGAGIGILTTNLVYYFKPLQGFEPFKQKNDVTFIPVIGAGEMSLICRF